MRFAYLFLFLFQFVDAQQDYPQDYFRLPLNIPISIAGSFGELRPNHFHSGIDFRTQKKEGLPVFAVADGYISRIKIGIGGYGKAIYISHPNGYTTVYGHLQHGNKLIEDFIKKQQYKEKSYEVEIFLTPQDLVVSKSDTIAFSGNTGSSGGPHLHFEIRNTATEKIINPLLFGYDKFFLDTKSPQINGVLAYPITNFSIVNGSYTPVFLNISLQEDGSYLADKVVASGTIGFAVNAYDTSDYNYGKNGLYAAEVTLNGLPYFNYKLDSFSFEETKFINTFIDYERYVSQNQRFQKLFVGDFYPENIIKLKNNNGLVSVTNNFIMNYKIVLKDFNNNETAITIPVSYGILPISTINTPKVDSYYLKSKIENTYTKENVTVFFPENTFYKDFSLYFDVKKDTLNLYNKTIAVNNPFTITFDVSKYPLKNIDKMFIANKDKSRIEYNKTFKKDANWSIKTKKMSNFFIHQDTIAPKIYKPNFKNGTNLNAKDYLTIHISDNLSGINTYNAFLNNEWILMEYEYKEKLLKHNLLDEIYKDGENVFKLIVTDNLGNSTTFESNFTKNK
jgi:murein DD-endopeptidase MepM/ murein hydrolase activator NlpD